MGTDTTDEDKFMETIKDAVAMRRPLHPESSQPPDCQAEDGAPRLVIAPSDAMRRQLHPESSEPPDCQAKDLKSGAVSLAASAAAGSTAIQASADPPAAVSALAAFRSGSDGRIRAHRVQGIPAV